MIPDSASVTGKRVRVEEPVAETKEPMTLQTVSSASADDDDQPGLDLGAPSKKARSEEPVEEKNDGPALLASSSPVEEKRGSSEPLTVAVVEVVHPVVDAPSVSSTSHTADVPELPHTRKRCFHAPLGVGRSSLRSFARSLVK